MARIEKDAPALVPEEVVHEKKPEKHGEKCVRVTNRYAPQARQWLTKHSNDARSEQHHDHVAFYLTHGVDEFTDAHKDKLWQYITDSRGNDGFHVRRVSEAMRRI